MFRKVFKYDMKSVGRIVAVLVPAVILMAVVAGLMTRVYGDDVSDMFFILRMTTGVLIFFCLLVVSAFSAAVTILCLRRYYTHFFSDEGYLTFTLPVKRGTLLWSKTLSAFVIVLASVIVQIISALAFIVCVPDGWSTFSKIASNAAAYLFPRYIPLVILVLFTCAASLFGGLALMHFSLTVGHAAAKKHSVLAAIGIWYGISAIKNTVTQIIGFAYLTSMDVYSTVDMTVDPVAAAEEIQSSVMNQMTIYMLIFLIFEAACFFLFYFLNYRMLKNRLSLS